MVLLLMSSSESPRVQCSGSSLGRRFVRVFRFVDHPSSYDRYVEDFGYVWSVRQTPESCESPV